MLIKGQERKEKTRKVQEMSKKETGIYQKDDGYWCFRFGVVVDGKTVYKKKSTDELGNKLRTRGEAIKAKNRLLNEIRVKGNEKKEKREKKKVREVFEEYAAKGRKDKASQTIRKQDSLWQNHISVDFGERYVDEITVAEVNDYLASLYYTHSYSYKYTESFLKMFYLIFGQAYSRNYLTTEEYGKLCLNKNSRIRMPKMKNEDDDEIVCFSDEELDKLDRYFEGSNAEIAYKLGRYCGLRIGEVYGLTWKDINFEEGYISINKQMQYVDGSISLVQTKTKNANRNVFIPDFFRDYLKEKNELRKRYDKENSRQRQQMQTMIYDTNGGCISSLEMVNCTPEGKIQTNNSMKYHATRIRELYGIDFKFHHLRHTYGTKMAEMNTPSFLLCNQMGHGNINVTQKYYLSLSENGIDIIKRNAGKI